MKTAELQSKKNASELHHQNRIMENHNVKTQIEKLSQQVQDSQLHVSNTNTTKEKRVRFTDDSVSSVQLLPDTLPLCLRPIWQNSDKASCASL
jgi:hypothetical protein